MATPEDKGGKPSKGTPADRRRKANPPSDRQVRAGNRSRSTPRPRSSGRRGR